MEDPEMLRRDDVRDLITLAFVAALISLPIIVAFYI